MLSLHVHVYACINISLTKKKEAVIINCAKISLSVLLPLLTTILSITYLSFWVLQFNFWCQQKYFQFHFLNDLWISSQNMVLQPCDKKAQLIKKTAKIDHKKHLKWFKIWFMLAKHLSFDLRNGSWAYYQFFMVCRLKSSAVPRTRSQRREKLKNFY